MIASAGSLLVLFLVCCAASTARGDDASKDAAASVERTVRVAVCQTFCVDGDREGNFVRVERAVEEAARQKAAIACFPETALLGWVNPEAHALADPIPGPTTDRLGALAKKHGLMIAIGLCERDGDALHDSAVLIDTDGTVRLKHRKVNVLTELMDPPYVPGDAEAIDVVETRYGRIGMLVCADTFRDDLVARIAEREADLLLVPYGWAADRDAWPEHGESLAAWVGATARRAGCPVVGTDLVGSISSGPWRGKTYGGQSPVARADGTIIGVLADRDAEVRTFEIVVGRVE
jgi:predicted amidohydrolase